MGLLKLQQKRNISMTTKFDIIKLKSLAALGNVEAMYTLACNYLYGVGVDVDLIQAHSYLGNRE